MIKPLEELSKKNKEYQKNFLKNCICEEKIDTHYVCVEIQSTSKAIFKKANGQIISQTDMILNKMWKKFVEDWNIIFVLNKSYFAKNVGMKIFMFYFPTTTPLNTNYSKFMEKKQYNDNLYIRSDFFQRAYVIVNVINKFSKIENINSFLENLNFGKSFSKTLEEDNRTCIKTDEYKICSMKSLKKDTEYLQKILEDVDNDDNAYDLSKIDKLFSHRDNFLNGGPGCQREGIILKYKKDIYQSKYNLSKPEREIDEEQLESTRTGFEYLLSDILKYLNKIDLNEYIASNYVKTVCNIYNAYIMNCEMVHHKIADNIDYKQLESPYLGETEINFEYIPNENTKALCKVNKLYENIFKIMLANLNKRKNYNYCVFLNKMQVSNWNEKADIIKSMTS